MDEETQVDDLIHSIKKGRMRYSLHLAVMLLVGLGILKFLFGSGMLWLGSSAWFSYIIIFAVTYFVAWPIKLGKAKDEIGEHEAEEVVSSQGAQDGSWKLALLILIGLLALTMFKSSAPGEVEEMDLAALEMKIMPKNAGEGEETTLKIPQSYINEEGPQDFGMSFSPESFIEEGFEELDMDFSSKSLIDGENFDELDMSFSSKSLIDEKDVEELDADFIEEIMSKSVMLSAKLDDIGLNPIYGEQADGEDGEGAQEIPYEEHELSPRTNPEMVAIEVDPRQIKIDEDMIEVTFDKMTRGEGSNIPMREENGLKLRSARVKLQDTNMKGFVEVDEVQMGVPVDPAMQHMFVACENKICMLRANIDGVSDASIYFHPSKLDEWDQIYWKMDQLLRGFVQYPDDDE